MRKSLDLLPTTTSPERVRIQECLRDSLEEHLLEYPSVKTFLDKLSFGDKYSIFDVDGTLFSGDSWGEAPQFPGFFRDPELYEKDRILFREGRIDAAEIRKRKYANMQSTISETLAATINHPDIHPGMDINDEILFQLGSWKAREIIQNAEHYRYAFDAIENIQKSGSKFLFLSASPRPFINGIIHELLKDSELNIDYDVLGTEIGVNSEGEIYNKLSIWGEEKAKIAELMKSRGVNIEFGAGDSPLKVDRFLPYAKSQLVINREDGDGSWKEAVEQFCPNVLKEKRVISFLNQIQRGDQYAILDVDGTIFRPSSWHTASILEDFMLEDVQKYKKDRQEYKAGRDTVNGMRRRRNANIIKKVTPELEDKLQSPDIKAGMDFNDRTLYYIGRFIAKKLSEDGEVYPDAIRRIHEMEKDGVNALFLSASPRYFIKGIIDELLDEDVSNIHVLGTEVDFENGTTKETCWFYGSAKEDIALAMQAHGAELVFGAGDSPNKNDRFLEYVQEPLIVDKDNGNDSWQK